MCQDIVDQDVHALVVLGGVEDEVTQAGPVSSERRSAPGDCLPNSGHDFVSPQVQRGVVDVCRQEEAGR